MIKLHSPGEKANVVMTLLVRNEEDILCQNIDYHLSQGVKHIIATNNLSTDRTNEILKHYESNNVLTIIDESNDDYDQSKWVSRMARMAYTDLNADWVINNDADEFWFAKGMDLVTFFTSLRDANIVIGKRSDMICYHHNKGPDTPFYKTMKYKKKTSLNSNGMPLPPKVAHISNPYVKVSQGNHDVNLPFEKKISNKTLEVLHFPIRSSKQFRQKIQLGGKAYSNNKTLSKSVGSTWRKMYDELTRTGNISYIDENIVSESDLQRMIANGEALLDLRLKQAIEEIHGVQ